MNRTTKRLLSLLLLCFCLVIGVATSPARSEAERKQEKLIQEVEKLEARKDALLERIEQLEKQCSELEPDSIPAEDTNDE